MIFCHQNTEQDSTRQNLLQKFKYLSPKYEVNSKFWQMQHKLIDLFFSHNKNLIVQNRVEGEDKERLAVQTKFCFGYGREVLLNNPCVESGRRGRSESSRVHCPSASIVCLLLVLAG